MDLTKFRIVDALSRDPVGGEGLSISDLVRKIRTLGHSAYYKNVYDRVQRMKDEGLVNVRTVGRMSFVSLRLDCRKTIDELSIMEIEKRRNVLRGDVFFREWKGLKSVALMKPEKGRKLNAFEVLYLVESEEVGKMRALLKNAKVLGDKSNRRINPLALTENEFLEMLESGERNVIKELFEDYVIILNPTGFWRMMGKARITTTKVMRWIDPNRIKKADRYHNLERFGYGAFTEGEPGEEPIDVDVETTIISCLLSEEARLREAVPILLTKNRINYRLLLFLALKYGKEGILSYLMGMTKDIVKDKKEDIKNGLNLFELFTKNHGEKEGLRLTKEDLEKKMRLYHAI